MLSSFLIVWGEFMGEGRLVERAEIGLRGVRGDWPVYPKVAAGMVVELAGTKTSGSRR